MFPEIKFKDKRLVLTGHIRHELYDVYHKNMDLLFEILIEGKYETESKDKKKILLKTKNGTWELVYAETEDDLVLVHLKLRRR